MNNHPQNPSQPRLKVVPPVVQDTPVAKPVEAPSPVSQPAPKSSNSLIIWGVVVLGISGIGMIPVNPRLSGATTITSTVGERQSITMPQAGKLMLSVRPNQVVNPGEILGIISSPELEKQIDDSQQKLAEGKTLLSAAQQQLIIAQSKLGVAKILEANAQQHFDKRQAELNAAISEKGLPKIRVIQEEQEGIENEIVGVQYQINGIENEILAIESEIEKVKINIQGLKKQLTKVESELTRLKPLNEEGGLGALAFGEKEKEFEELKSQILQEEQQIKTYQQQINQKRNQILQTNQLKHQKDQTIKAKSEQINEVAQLSQENLDQAQFQVQQRMAESVSSQKELEAASTEILNQEKLVIQQEAELKRLQEQKQQLTLKTTIAGTVTTPDLDLLNNRTLEAGKEILNIVNLSQLTGLAEIRQEDIDLINQDSPVIFKPRQAEFHQYQAQIEDIQPVIQFDESKQKSVLKIKISIDNADQKLQAGSTGEAHFETPKMRVYQVVQREIFKLFPWWKL
ncbi:MAG: efflux RND transporter periplasmic adaptor subunit [Planktothrix sp.]